MVNWDLFIIAHIEKEERELEKGFTIWFTGLSGAGKTTIAHRVEGILREMGHNVEVLDGDVVRTHLSKGLGFSKEDRDTNIKRIGFVCKLLSRNGVVAIASAISPYREVRDFNRKEIGDFVEVFVKCSVDVCKKRDVKGLYKKAANGEIPNFTGVSDPYEEPLNPEVILETDKETVEESTEKLLRKLGELGYVKYPPQEAEEQEIYTPEEEAKIAERLTNLGYL
ncbi:MAG TPA: adenylyl-sulfate kinase [Candidatus Brocadiia bacterium]